MPTSFTTRKLQRYLENHYGDSVVIQSQQGQGKSNMIMSSNITLGDAIKAASNLKAELKWSNEKQTRRMYSEQTDDQLLYSAASIIRRDIDKVRIFKEHYPTSTDVSFENSLQAVFQTKSAGVHDYGSERIKRGIERSLAIDDTTASLTDAIPYLQPKCRSEPPRRSDAFDKLQLWDYNKSDDVDQIWGADVTVVAYPPIIDSKPNDMATVYTAMKKCLDMSNDAGQDYAIQTFDQQLYAIAQQVKWSKPDIFNRHILRLGGFHSLSCFLASIGKLWADGGLRDLLVDSGVYAGNTAELMLNGKEFNRADLDYFDQIPSAFWNVLLEFHTSICDQTDQASDIKTRLEKLFEDHVQPLIGMFKEWGHDTSPTFKYWDMFLVAVQIMLSNVRAEREGNWSAHLMSSSKMLPYFYITNRTNYSRWMPVYILDMLELPAEIESAFELGEFSIRQKHIQWYLE
ncbi:unnamed protein product [Mytilus coruscus]|uniref:Uncharacterized protein n=1 Tax=Mytilus coruscus TaxID=42192 RepID=A0A6J8CZ77_MYTCO|nr:unnamed protein product [Mytilus coruscus]